MPKLSKESKITLVVLTAIVVAFIGYRIMEDLPIFQQSQVVYTYYDKVSGLTVGSYVYMSGVKIGSVRNFKLVKGDSVKVTLGFRPGVTITKGAKAVLKSTGLIGGSAIYIKGGDGTHAVPEGATIPGVSKSSFIQSFSSKAQSIANSVNKTLNRLNSTIAQIHDIVGEKMKRESPSC